jgi:hypothetical protein
MASLDQNQLDQNQLGTGEPANRDPSRRAQAEPGPEPGKPAKS